MRFIEPGESTADDGFSQIVTKFINGTDDPLLAEAIQALVTYEQREKNPRWYWGGHKILLTTEQKWSGYSEYTITQQWTQVVVSIPTLNYEREFADIPTFFAALSQHGERDGYA